MMLYLIGLVFPPAAVLACGKPWQAFFVSIPLTLCFWFPGVLHAWAVASAYRNQPAPVLVQGVQPTPANNEGMFSSLCFFVVGACIAMYWLTRTAIFTPN